MARFVLDPNRVNFSVVPRGKEYNFRVLQRSKAIFDTLLNYLASNYVASVQGANYTNQIKAIAVELAKLELALEDIHLDQDYAHTRGEFLYSMIGYMVFLNGRLPTLDYSDTEFRKFLTTLIGIYLKGAIPDAVKDAVDLLITDETVVLENFLLTRANAAGLDISDQFGFQVVVQTSGAFPAEIFQLESTIRTILDVIRAAHTLFTVRYLFTDTYIPSDPSGQIVDAMRWDMFSYYYEDYRTYWNGMRDIDRLGRKQNLSVGAEDHTADF